MDYDDDDGGGEEGEDRVFSARRARLKTGMPGRKKASLLGLLAKIKCSICSYQLNI